MNSNQFKARYGRKVMNKISVSWESLIRMRVNSGFTKHVIGIFLGPKPHLCLLRIPPKLKALIFCKNRKERRMLEYSSPDSCLLLTLHIYFFLGKSLGLPLLRGNCPQWHGVRSQCGSELNSLSFSLSWVTLKCVEDEWCELSQLQEERSFTRFDRSGEWIIEMPEANSSGIIETAPTQREAKILLWRLWEGKGSCWGRWQELLATFLFFAVDGWKGLRVMPKKPLPQPSWAKAGHYTQMLNSRSSQRKTNRGPLSLNFISLHLPLWTGKVGASPDVRDESWFSGFASRLMRLSFIENMFLNTLATG